MINRVTRRTALIGLSSVAAFPGRAQTAPAGRPKEDNAEYAELERPAVFEVVSATGSLKETAQKGQELIWHRKGTSAERRFQVTNIAIAFLRSETGGQVKMTFSCNVSSLGYSVDEAKLNVIIRSKGGAAMYTWSLAIAVKCADKNQSLTPQTQDVPHDVAANVFTNAGSVEVTEFTESNFPGVKVQRCE
jgi:hypothetical protein